MTTIAPNRHSRPVMRCVQCGDELLAPEWSEYPNERQVRYLWSCWKCDCCFETVAKIDRRYQDKGRYSPNASGRIFTLRAAARLTEL
jgi:hypothetical protein